MLRFRLLSDLLRGLQVQANPRQSPHTLQSVLAIKGLKGVIIDHDAVARETKNYSKNVLDFARVESTAPGNDTADIQDVGDRLAFLTYKAGEVGNVLYKACSRRTRRGERHADVNLVCPCYLFATLSTQLHEQHAKRLESARIALKDIRNYENTINPQRQRRSQLEREIGKLRTATKPDTTSNQKIETLQTELDALLSPTSDLSKSELEAVNLKRRMLAESFNTQFDSMQELGEKLAIIAGYGRTLVKDWNVSPSTAGKNDYVDGARTAAVRHGVESDLSAWDIRKPRIAAPTLNVGGGGLHHAPSFRESHADELASMHSVEDPVAAHKEALDSYYNRPPSPAALYQAQYGSGSGSAGSAAPVPIPGVGAPSPPMGSGSHAASGASPLVQQLNTAPVHNLPPPTMAGSASDSAGIRSSGSNSGISSGHIGTSPMGSAVTPPSMPTVAETGAPISGTGGPSKGVLSSSDTRPDNVSAAQSKQEEARQDLARRFEEYSGHTGPSAGPSDDSHTADLEREISMRARQGHETLPAYTAAGSDSNVGASTNAGAASNPFADSPPQ